VSTPYALRQVSTPPLLCRLADLDLVFSRGISFTTFTFTFTLYANSITLLLLKVLEIDKKIDVDVDVQSLHVQK